jgi:hypothetical protein
MRSRTRNLITGIMIWELLIRCGSVAHAQGASPQFEITPIVKAVRAGFLTCQVANGWGFILGSSRKMNCTYGRDPNHTERYTGTISKFGVDIGYLHSGVILWSVLAPTNDPDPGALAGHYGGATASAAVGVGAGANVLIGGFQHSIALQPVSIEAQNGLNVAAGITELTLKYVGQEPQKTS